MMALWPILAVAALYPAIFTVAVQHCDADDGGGVCPEGNRCCKVHNTSGCIPNDMGSLGTCCQDDKTTGCPQDYDCIENQHCKARDASDPFVQVLPRYSLCTAPEISTVYGFPVVVQTNSTHDDHANLIYYSTHGDLLEWNDTSLVVDHHVVIGIHGSGRNADDYFCVLKAAAPNKRTIILAPRFPIPSDHDINITHDARKEPLVWSDQETNGVWRYGADALHVPISSFTAMDRFVDSILAHTQHVTVVGHSSGGQFVQRWSLLSRTAAKVRSIVANPSSYAYLSPPRWYDGEWRVPPSGYCSRYNQWEWGLDPPYHTVPYLESVMNKLSIAQVRARLASHHVVYLIGNQDRCSGETWCASHGLETTCADELQGHNRWERHHRYLLHLDRWNIPYTHFTVPKVGHDHSLMFHSPIGQQVIFRNAGGDNTVIE